MFKPALAVCLLTLVAASPAIAASFTANSSVDAPDDNPGDGLCRSEFLPPSFCTLRAAIMEANALPGSHIINLQSGRMYTLTVSGLDDNALSGDLDITKSVIIRCLDCEQRPLLNVNGNSRGFDIHAGNVTLEGFDIAGAKAFFSPTEDRGGAVAIRQTAGTVLLHRMRLYDNQARFGGAIDNAGGYTTISDSELFENLVTTSTHGSAILNNNDLVLRNSLVFGNSSNSALWAIVHTIASDGLPGRLKIENSTISSNIGPGLNVVDSQLTQIFSSTIAGNVRGLLVSGASPILDIRNSIIGRNHTADCVNTAGNLVSISTDSLYSDTSCSSLASAADLQNIDPLLSPLKLRRGGTMETALHWPRPDSPALSAGSTQPIGEPGGCLSTDQVGISRPQGYNGTLRCDIGAAEVPDDAIFFDSLETL